MNAVTSIVDSTPKGNLLVCTHGGCTWGVISFFKPTFDYEDYKLIRTPDVFRIIYDDGEPSLDEGFRFNAQLVRVTS